MDDAEAPPPAGGGDASLEELHERGRSRSPRLEEEQPVAVAEVQAVRSACQPLRFAAIADIQYADIEDRRGRRYRGTLGVTRRAVDFFNAHPRLDFVLHGGDIVDFYNTEGDFANDGGQATALALGAVMEELSRLRCPRLVSLLGNHELYNWSRVDLVRGVPWAVPRAQLQGTLRFCPQGSSEIWHSFRPCPGWRCIVLDPYDVSIYRLGRGPQPAPYNYTLDKLALAELCRHNPNVAAFVAERPGENILCDYFKGLLSGPEQRWVPFNGGIGPTQLEWFREELADAAASGDRVVVLSHVLVHPDSSVGCKTLLWNYEEVLKILHSPLGEFVELVVSGHQHSGGFHTDHLGMHYLVLESPLNTGEDQTGCFLIAEMDGQSLTLRGYGNAQSPIFPGVPEGSLANRILPLRGASRI